MLEEIQRYGSIRPQGVGRSSSQIRMEALSNLGKNISNVGFGLLAEKRAKEGQIEGAEAGRKAAESGQAPVEQKSLFPSIYEESFNNSQQAAYLAGVDRMAVERLSELENEHSHDPEAYSKSAQGLLEGVLKNAPETYKHALNESINNYVSRGTTRINNNVVKRAKEEAKSELLGAIDTYSREASKEARNGNVEAVQELIGKVSLSANALVKSGELTQEEADDQVRVSRNETTAQTYLQIVDDSSIEEASKVIEEAEKSVPAGFSGDEWDKVIARAKMRLKNKMLSQAKSGGGKPKDLFRDRETALRIAVDSGDADPDKLQEELFYLYEQKVFTPTQTAGIYSKIWEGVGEQEKVWNRYHGDSSIVVQPKAVDNVYRKDIAGMESGDKVDFVRRVNLVPDTLKKEILNNLHSGDIQTAAGAADMIVRMEEIQGLPDTFKSTDKAYAAQLSRLIEIYEPETAVKMAREITDPKDQTRIEAAQEFIKKQYKKGFSDYAEKAMGPFFGKLDPMIAPNITKDYETAFKQNYINGMDEDQAHEAAERDLKRVYQEWMGRPMKYSPDKYYQVEGSTDWIAGDVVKELRANIAGSPDILDFYLIPTDQTAREAELGKPSYIIRYKTSDGWDSIGRYYPDIEAAKAGKIEGNKELVKKMREQSRQRAGGLNNLSSLSVM